MRGREQQNPIIDAVMSSYYSKDGLEQISSLLSEQIGNNTLHQDAFIYACAYSDANVVSVFLNHKNFIENKYHTFLAEGLHQACKSGKSEIAKLLLDKLQVCGVKPYLLEPDLILNVRTNNLAMIQVILSHPLTSIAVRESTCKRVFSNTWNNPASPTAMVLFLMDPHIDIMVKKEGLSKLSYPTLESIYAIGSIEVRRLLWKDEKYIQWKGEKYIQTKMQEEQIFVKNLMTDLMQRGNVVDVSTLLSHPEITIGKKIIAFLYACQFNQTDCVSVYLNHENFMNQCHDALLYGLSEACDANSEETTKILLDAIITRSDASSLNDFIIDLLYHLVATGKVIAMKAILNDVRIPSMVREEAFKQVCGLAVSIINQPECLSAIGLFLADTSINTKLLKEALLPKVYSNNVKTLVAVASAYHPSDEVTQILKEKNAKLTFTHYKSSNNEGSLVACLSPRGLFRTPEKSDDTLTPTTTTESNYRPGFQGK